jgi:hypothetical protein
MRTTRRPEHRIAAFIAKHQIGGEQDWDAEWISFRAVAEYCAKLRTPRGAAAAGDAGVRFAYAELVNAIDAGEFEVGGQSRVLLLVSHGGKILSIKPSELLEAQQAFEPEIFRTGYMEQCWAPRELIARWFSKRGIPPPWAQQTKGTLRVGRGRPVGAADQARDLEVIGRALEMRHERKMSGRQISIRKAIGIAVQEGGSKVNRDGEETDRLRLKLRKRLKLRNKNRSR